MRIECRGCGRYGDFDYVAKKLPEPVKRSVRSNSCNRHTNCDAADAKAKAKGAFMASHCHDDCCEDCFGC